jgi:ABC-type Fe3+ transport system substrate-binding protein
MITGEPSPKNGKLYYDFMNSKEGHEIGVKVKTQPVRPPRRRGSHRKLARGEVYECRSRPIMWHIFLLA